MKRPDIRILVSLNKTVESSLKPMSSSTSSSNSCNSLLINSSINCDKSAVQERMTLSSNVQSLMPDTVPADCSLIIDDPTLTQDFMSTEVSNCIYSGDTIQCSSNASNYNDLLKLPSSSDSYTHTLFKEQLHDKNIEKTLTSLETKLHRTYVTVEEVSGKLDILIMNMNKLIRVLIPSEKRITRPEKMPSLPLKEKQHLKQFDLFLEKDHNLAAACHYMSNYMKLSVKNPERKSATNMLTKLLSNTLASEMNCDGSNEKIAFKTLKLYNLFQGTLQIAFPDSDLTEANATLAAWLKDAKWRKQCDGSAGNRKKKIVIT